MEPDARWVSSSAFLPSKQFAHLTLFTKSRSLIKVQQWLQQNINFSEMITLQFPSPITACHQRGIKTARLTANRFLHLIGLSGNALCTFFSTSIESLRHLFWSCTIAQYFLNRIKMAMREQFSEQTVCKEIACFF